MPDATPNASRCQSPWCNGVIRLVAWSARVTEPRHIKPRIKRTNTAEPMQVAHAHVVPRACRASELPPGL